jgi:hypothetical protein
MSTSGSQEPLRLSRNDLYSPRVDAFVEEQAVLNRALPETEPQPFLVRIFYSSYFYLSLASGLGGFVAWLIIEPFINDNSKGFEVGDALVFPMVMGLVGLFLGAAEGMMSRNLQRAAICAAVGLGIGFAGAFVAWILAEIIYNVAGAVAMLFWRNPQQGQRPTGLALLILMMGRASAWAVAASPAGIGQGIAMRENKVLLNGLLGGVLGGLLGGLVFDPISVFFTSPDGQALVSRAI